MLHLKYPIAVTIEWRGFGSFRKQWAWGASSGAMSSVPPGAMAPPTSTVLRSSGRTLRGCKRDHGAPAGDGRGRRPDGYTPTHESV
jgi:hypothetical protein